MKVKCLFLFMILVTLSGCNNKIDRDVMVWRIIEHDHPDFYPYLSKEERIFLWKTFYLECSCAKAKRAEDSARRAKIAANTAIALSAAATARK